MNKKFREWADKHLAGLFVFNLLVLLLIMLQSIGYFDPFLKITATLIIVIAMVLSIFLLGVRANGIIILTLLFWSIGFIFKIFKIDIWAERLGIYTFYSLLLLLPMFIIELIRKRD